MDQTQTVTINGRLYDAATGMPINQKIEANKPQPKVVSVDIPASRPSSQNASSIHSHMQRSKTLSRRFTKKPQQIKSPAAAPATSTANSVRVRNYQAVTKSPAISKFAPNPQQPTKARGSIQSPSPRRVMNDIAPVGHPVVAKVQKVQAQKTAVSKNAAKPIVDPMTPKHTPKSKPVHQSSQVVKNSAIEKALKNAPSKKDQKSPKKRSFFARHPRLLSVASASLALVLLGGYFTYLNMPNLSVRVAAVQAGVDASYPDYQPDGYRLSGPVAAENGKVQMTFASNSGPQGFTVTQEKSGWDSSAVADNLVAPRSNDSYVTTNERGLTIFTYNGNAAWVNKGILYTIEGDAPLSSEQIRRIATSL